MSLRFEKKSYWIRVGSKCNDSVLIRSKKKDTQRHRETLVKMEAEVRLIELQAVDSQGRWEPRTVRGRKRFFLRAFRKSMV